MNEAERKVIVGAICKAINEKFAVIEKRMAELETVQKNFEYKGIWQRAITYQRGNEATHSGLRWACLRETAQQPGQSGDWQLCHKPARR